MVQQQQCAKFFNKLEDIQCMSATRSTPITKEELSAQVYVHIKNNWLYDTPIDKLDNRIAPYKTWENFKQDF